MQILTRRIKRKIDSKKEEVFCERVKTKEKYAQKNNKNQKKYSYELFLDYWDYYYQELLNQKLYSDLKKRNNCYFFSSLIRLIIQMLSNYMRFMKTIIISTWSWNS